MSLFNHNTCPFCGKPISPNQDYCSECGDNNTIDNTFDYHSHFENNLDTHSELFCNNHTEPISNNIQTSSQNFTNNKTQTESISTGFNNFSNYETDCSIPKEKKITLWATELIITLFFGVFGLHKFLKKQIVLGIIYMLSYGLFGVGVLIDVIMLITKYKRIKDQ